LTDPWLDVRRAMSRPAETLDRPGLRRASVAMVLLPKRQVLFIRRAERIGDPWSGQVGFPGGHEEPEDADLLDTARRETQEELGLELRRDQCLGTLSDIRTRPVRNRVVRPFVFALPFIPDLAPNEEVAGVHRWSLDALLAGVGRKGFPFDGVRGLTLPSVEFHGVRLWGLTLRIVDELLHRLDGRGTGLSRPRPPSGS